MAAAGALRTTAHSLQRDFDCEAAADFHSNHLNHSRSDANDNSGPAAPGRAHDHTAGGAGDNCGMDAMDEWSAIPPPPRDDVSLDSEENDRRVDHPRSQLHRRRDDRGGLGEPSADELDVTLDSTLFGTLSCCGEDTLHVLMDAELALASARAPGNVNLGAGDLGAGGTGIAGDAGAGDWRAGDLGAGGDESAGGGMGLAGAALDGPTRPRNDGHEAGGSALRPSTGSTIHANDPHNPNNPPNDDDEDDHLSTGAASLLRGPLMAAKSANLAGTTAGGETPSKARDELLRSAMKAPRPPSGGASSMETVHLTPTAAAAHGGGTAEASATPSTARNGFLRAAVQAARPPSGGEASGGSAGYSADFHGWDGQSPGHGAGTIVGALGSVTPSAARAGFVTSARKAPPRPGTSHSARSGPDYCGGISGAPQEMGSAGGQVDGAPRNFGNDGNHHNSNDLGEAPSRPRAGLTISTRKPRRRPPSLPLAANSPSAARNEFLTSPQDSVSTLGARSPTEEAAVAARAAAGLGAAFGGAGLGAAPRRGGAPGAMPPGPHSQGMQQSASRGAGAAMGGRMPPGATTPSTQRRLIASPPSATSASPPTASPALPGRTAHAASLDGILARGERQIRDSVAAAEAVLLRTTDHSNDNAVRPATTPRRPFLRKGARKEPSALHTLHHREAVTPSAQQQSHAGANTPHSADNSEAVAPSGAQRQSPAEAPSDRQARLARLEQMQEDLRDDLRRREGRKEAARNERRAKAREERAEKQMQREERERAEGKAGVGTAAAAGTSRPRPSATPAPLQARSASAGRRRAEHGAGVAEMTPSQIRNSVARREGAPTPSRARSAGKPAATVARGSPSGGGRDGTTPSRARVSSATKAPADEEGSLAEGHGGDDGLADVCVEGRTLPLDASEGVASSEEPESTPTPPPRSRPSSRPRTASAPKNRTAGTGPRKTPTSAGRTPHPTRKGKARPPKDDSDDQAKRAEWKREEDEQRALLKNMRRRQEAALREAEGERERAKAWAAAEKASVQQWAAEQRALIKKDRHKAANAALLATKNANRAQERVEGSDAQLDREELRAELDDVRAALRKMKAAAGDEARRLRETIRRHERTIGTLRSATNSNNAGGDEGAGGGATAAAKAKSPNGGGGAAPRRRALSDYSSRQNARPSGPKSDANRRKSSEGGLEAPKKPIEAAERPEAAEVDVDEVVATEEAGDTDTLTEEPTDLWLHRHLAQLNAAHDRPGAKVSSDGPQLGEGVAPEPPAGQRKPYNAADYGGSATAHAFPTQSLSRPDRVDAVPKVVTAVSPSFQAAIGSGVHQGQEAAPGKSQIFTYKNGTQKEVLPDGTTTVSFANGDRKRTYAHEKEGIVVYYYAATKTTQVTHRDGMQTYHFPNKQIENHYTDGRKEITYPDGTTRMVHLDGTCDTTFADGVRVVDYVDGTQRVMQA